MEYKQFYQHLNMYMLILAIVSLQMIKKCSHKIINKLIKEH